MLKKVKFPSLSKLRKASLEKAIEIFEETQNKATEEILRRFKAGLVPEAKALNDYWIEWHNEAQKIIEEKREAKRQKERLEEQEREKRAILEEIAEIQAELNRKLAEINNKIINETLSLTNLVKILARSLQEKEIAMEKLANEILKLKKQKERALREQQVAMTFIVEIQPILELWQKDRNSAYVKYRNRLKSNPSQVETKILETLHINPYKEEHIDSLEPAILISVANMAYKRFYTDFEFAKKLEEITDAKLKEAKEHAKKLLESVEATKRDFEEAKSRIKQIKEHILEESKKEPIWAEIEELKRKKKELEKRLAELQ